MILWPQNLSYIQYKGLMQSQQRINNPINSSKLLTNKTWDFMLLKILIASVVIFDWWILLISDLYEKTCDEKVQFKKNAYGEGVHN